MIWKTAIKKTNQIHSSTSDNELTEKRQLNNWQCHSLSPHHCKTNCPRAILETLTNWKDYWKDLRARICGSTPSKSVGCVDVVDITDVGDVALPTACLAPHHCNVNRQVCHCALRSLGGCWGLRVWRCFLWEPWDLADGYEFFNGGIHRQFVSHSREINVIISNTFTSPSSPKI